MSNTIKILCVKNDTQIDEKIFDELESQHKIDLINSFDYHDTIEQIRNQAPDIIITNICSLKPESLKLLKQIRDMDPNITIIATYREVNAILNSLDLDIDGYFITPINKNKFLDKLNKIINRITIYKQFEKQKFTIKKFQIIFEKSPVSIVVTDKDFYIEFTNEKFKEYFCNQCSNAKNISAESYKCHIVNCRRILNKNLLSAISNHNETINLDLEISDKCYNNYYSVYATPMFIDKNIIANYIFIIEDITKYKSIQLQLLQSHRVEAICHLSAGIAHEFNNFLTAISGYTSVIKLKAKDENILEYTDKILDSVYKASQMTKNLLAIARNDIIDPELQPLNPLIKLISKMFTKLAGEKITIIIEDFDEKIEAVYDLSSMEQALYNILKNSTEALKDGGIIKILINKDKLKNIFPIVMNDDKDDEFAVITISDNGCGMEKEILDKAFEPFFTTKRIGDGSGLGLAITYGIVKQNNGYITLESEKGKGTTVKVLLPMKIKNTKNKKETENNYV
jgi:nitrogen-specific signal transduction histidine kinase